MATKPTKAKSAAAKPVAKAPAKPRAKAATAATAAKDDNKEASGATLRLKSVVEQVAATTSVKKKDAKAVILATLAILGDALSKGDDINLPPLGKVKVSRQKETDGGDLLIVKIKRGGAKKAPKDQDDDEDGVEDDGE